MADRANWARMVVTAPDGTHLEVPLAGDGPPDLAVVEALARFQLMARRAGGRMWLEDVSAALGELLDLAGLREEMAGQGGQPSPPDPERREQKGPGQEGAAEPGVKPGPPGQEPRASR